MMIIQFRLKLDKLYCIGVMNQQKKMFLMSCQINYWFNRQETLQKTKEKYSKEKAADYYKQNKEAMKEKSKERYKNLSQEKKTKLKSIKYIYIYIYIYVYIYVYIYIYIYIYISRICSI